MEELNIRSLIDINRLQKIQDRFAEATGLALITVDCKGTPVTAASSFTSFCTYLREDPARQRRCFNCDAHGGLQSAIDGKPYIYQCHSGLVDFSVPIMLGDQYLGAILCGQVKLAEGQDKLDFVTAEDESWRSDPELVPLFEEVQVADFSKLHSCAETLYELASYLVEREYLNSVRTALQENELKILKQTSAQVRLENALKEAESLLPEDRIDPSIVSDTLDTMGRFTSTEEPSEPAEVTYLEQPVHRLSDHRQSFDFTALARAIGDEDLVGAMRVVNQSLDRLFETSGRHIGKARLIEVEDRLVQFAQDSFPAVGWELHQRVLRHRAQQYAHLTRYDCQTYLESLLFCLYDGLARQSPRRQKAMTDLLNLIERNTTKFLTLQKAAEFLSVSPSHLSKTFKTHTGTNFINYVTDKRIERAKLMLAHTDMAVLKIAIELGFQPVNYFSRAFKKNTGMTPSEFRRFATAEEHTA